MSKNIFVSSYVRMPPRNWPSGRLVTDNEIVGHWMSGLDTYSIAILVGVQEHEIERRLHQIKDARRQDQEFATAQSSNDEARG